MENWMGQIQIKVDAKGRLSLPGTTLKVFKSQEIVLSVQVYQKKTYLELLNIEEWKKKIEDIEKLSSKNPKVRAYKRFLISGSAKITIDKQNRINVPSYQRDMIGLDAEAVLVNLEEKIELWSKTHWKETSSNFLEDFENLENWIHQEDENDLCSQSEISETHGDDDGNREAA